MRRIVASLAVCTAVLVPSAALATAADRLVFPPSAEPYGVAYREWFSRYSIWLQEIPVPENPLVDPNSPTNCEPHGRVVFIAPSGTGDDGCSIPEGKAMAFSPLGFECSTAEGDGETFRELRDCAIEGFASFAAADISDLTLNIDGTRVRHPRLWIWTTPGEIVNFPDNNIWGVEGGETRSILKGFFFIIAPLDEGRHDIRVHAVDPELGELVFSYDVRVRD